MDECDLSTQSHKLKSLYSSNRPSLVHDEAVTDRNPHPSLLRSKSDSKNNPHRSTISLASTFSEHSTRSTPSSRSSRAFSSSAQSSTTYDYDDEPSSLHPLSQMGARRFWAQRERQTSRFSLQQARERVRLAREFRWSDPSKPQQPQSPMSTAPDRDRVAEAREWIENQCLTAGFGDLDLGKPPSPPLSSKKSSFSLAPSSRRESTVASIPDSEIPTSAEDLQTRIDVLSERIAERERKIKTRQHLERVQGEDEEQIVRAPSIEVFPEKGEAEVFKSVPVELDSRSVTNLSILEETDEKEDELPQYSNPDGVSVVDFKDYRPPSPPQTTLSYYHLVEPEQYKSVARSEKNSFPAKPVAQSIDESKSAPVVMVGNEVRAVPGEETDLEQSRSPNRPLMHQRTLSAPGDRTSQSAPDYQQSGRGRSVSIDTRNPSPTMCSPTNSAATMYDSTSTAATTPCEDVKNAFLTVESARPPPLPSSVPVYPIVYCSDPIALCPQEHPSEESSIFSDLESLAGAYRVKPKSSMSNLQRNFSMASQAPIPVRNATTKSQRFSYLAGQAPIPDAPSNSTTKAYKVLGLDPGFPPPLRDLRRNGD